MNCKCSEGKTVDLSHYIRTLNNLLGYVDRVEVLVTLTTDVGRILARLHQVQPRGNISFLSAVRVAHVSLCFCCYSSDSPYFAFAPSLLFELQNTKILYAVHSMQLTAKIKHR